MIVSVAQDADTTNGSANFTLSAAGLASQGVTAMELDDEGVITPDIVLDSVTADGRTTLTVQYQILNLPVTTPIRLRFLQSTDMLADGTHT